MGTKNSGVMPNFDCIIKVGTSPETAEPIGDKVDFLKEKMPEVPTELRDCSRELEYIEDMIEENEAEHDRLEERRDELEVVQAKYKELQLIDERISKFEESLHVINLMQKGFDVSIFPSSAIEKIANFLQNERDAFKAGINILETSKAELIRNG